MAKVASVEGDSPTVKGGVGGPKKERRGAIAPQREREEDGEVRAEMWIDNKGTPLSPKIFTIFIYIMYIIFILRNTKNNYFFK